MKFTAVLAKSESPLWSFHIPVPEGVAQHFLSQNHKRVVCNLNGKEEFQCALMPKGDGSYFIIANKQLRNKLHLKVGDEVNVFLKKDESKYGLPMPEELQELLNQDGEGNRLFHALTPGKQRNLLYIAGKPKRAETRLKKSIVIVEHLKAQKGKIDFKQLNVDMKNANDFL